MKLLIIRLLSTSLLIWAISYVYIASSNRIQGVGMEKLWSQGRIEKDELSKNLATVEKLGSREECIEARYKWMLFLLRMNVIDESAKQAEKLEADLLKDKKMSPEEKLAYIEGMAMAYRSAQKFDKTLPLYKGVLKDAKNIQDKKRRDLLIAKIENNLAVNHFFEGLSTHAPSKKHFEKRIEKFQNAKTKIAEAASEVKQIQTEKSDTTSDSSVYVDRIINSNIDEINLEIANALFRKRLYDEASK